ncbi:MAG: GspMb/PilO family protein, partial [Candidatus Omnitrophota bacterium]
EKEYAEYKEYVQRPAGKDDELSMILKEVESMASLSGVKITSVKPKGEKNLPAYREYMVELSCEGKLDEYMKYIYELEGSKRLLKVERLILTLKGSGSDLLKAAIIIRKISF